MENNIVIDVLGDLDLSIIELMIHHHNTSEQKER